MTVLVTGVAGFIGFHVARALLARGHAVLGIDDVNDYYDPALKQARLDALAHPAFRFVRCDFTDADALHRALGAAELAGIVHLGAQAGVRHSLEAPAAYVAANVAGHLNILELARARRCPHLVYASSSSVYGGNPGMPFATGDSVRRPTSLYAATKAAGELMSEAYAHLFRLPQTGLRFFTVYGPWGRPDMAAWLFTAAVLEGRPVRLFNHGAMQRDFTYVDDIVAGVLAAVDRPPLDDGSAHAGGSTSPHALYNLGAGQPQPLRALLDAVEAACGRSAVVELLPMQPGDVAKTWADTGPARRDLGYAPQVGVAEGVRRFVDWYRRFYGV